MKILKRYYPSFLILVMIALATLPIAAQDATPEPACQSYRLTVDQGRIRNSPSETAAVVGAVHQPAPIRTCIQGVAENNLPWLVIQLQDGEGNSRQGYISSTIVEPGEPGQITDPEAYCDGYRVIPDEAIVRAGPSTTFDVLGTFAAGDIICVEDYVYQYYGWSNVYQPDGATGWVNSPNITYQYDAELACPNEESYVVSTAATLYTAPARSSATSSRFAVGTKLCLTTTTEEENSWVTFTMPDREGRTGWMVIDLLEPVADIEDLRVGQVASGTPIAATDLPATGGAASPIPTTEETCVMYRVDSPQAARVRAQPSTNSTLIDSLSNAETVCVIGIEEQRQLIEHRVVKPRGC
ncbi:MAG: SH3 domain-containing protein [Anaerolineae bacterium]|nr:SH3 domain-containing protein [Anaerolineae bacterium]